MRLMVGKAKAPKRGTGHPTVAAAVAAAPKEAIAAAQDPTKKRARAESEGAAVNAACCGSMHCHP